jgi:hypothetical protein
MIYRSFGLLVLCLFLASCGNILLHQEVIQVEEFTPKINHSLSLRSQTKDGFLMDYTKTFFGKDDSTYKCLKALRKERYHLMVNNSGNITEQILNHGLNYNDYEFIDGMPCKVSKNDLVSSVLFLTFYDLNEKETRSFKTSLLSYLPGRYNVSDMVKLIYVNDNEYYFYGILKSSSGQRIFISKISKGEVIDFAFTEEAYQINEVYVPKLLPNGDIYFLTSINEEFGFPYQKWLVKYSYFLNKLSFESKFSNLKGDFGPNTKLVYQDGELLAFPEMFSQNNTKYTAYSISRSGYSITEKVIQMPDQGTTTGIKVFETQLGQYIGYTNNKNEVIISKLNTDFSLKPAFKVNSLELSSMVTINNADRVYEFDPPKQTGDAVETKMRVHTGLVTYRDLVLFRGVGYRETCN